LERVIEENKDRYFETLEQSSQRWHEGTHDPWPYINYILFILKTAYREFEERVGELGSPRGAKTEMVLGAIRNQQGEFRLADIERACPGVGREWIRKLLADSKSSGEVSCRGKGWPRAGATRRLRVVTLSAGISPTKNATTRSKRKNESVLGPRDRKQQRSGNRTIPRHRRV
jgi:hypothetical protein